MAVRRPMSDAYRKRVEVEECRKSSDELPSWRSTGESAVDPKRELTPLA